MSSSLGFRRGADFVANRPGEARPVQVPPPVSVLSMESSCKRPYCSVTFGVPKGFVPLLLMSSYFLTLPLVNDYVEEVDYTTTLGRGLTIGAIGGAACLFLIANDCVALYNFVFFLHLGLEVNVLDTLSSFAQEASTADEDMVLAWVAFSVIIAHLLPFLCMDNKMFLALTAAAGVVVNNAVLVFLDVQRMPVVAVSSLFLLGLVICAGKCGVCCSMNHCCKRAMRSGSWMTCSDWSL